MFDFVQEKKRFVYIILALMVLPFAFFGLDSYRHSENAQAPATVNGVKISAQELDNSLRQQQEQLRQRMGANFNPALFDTPEMKRAVLDNLIAQRVLLEQARAAGLIVTDDQIAQLIASIESFQENGKFDKKRYESVLANNNLSPLMYEASVRDDLVRQQMNEVYARNGYASVTLADKLIRLNEQQRVVSMATIPLQPLMTTVKVEQADIKKYYEENAKDFAVPEQVKVEYVMLATEDLLDKVSVSTDELHAYYESRKSEFGTPEQRQVSHILINASAKAPQSEQDAAKIKAADILAQVRRAPAKFAELAQQYSQDPGSAANGGDLGFFGKGMMVKPFEDAAFALNQGEISGLVKSDFGYHIIKVVAIKPARVPSFDEVRESILNKLRQQKASERFAELAEKFSNIVYEQSDTLKPAADLVGAKIEQSGWLIKGTPSAEPWNAKSLLAIFSDDVVKNKRNTPAIEVNPTTLLSARVLEFKPASVKPLSEVQAMIQQKLVRTQAALLASQQGKEALAALQKSGKANVSWEASQSITRAQHNRIEAGLVRQVFQADATKLPQFVGAEMSQGGYAIVRVDAVKEAAPPDTRKQASYVQQLRQMSGDEVFQAFMADAKAHANIKINLPTSPTSKIE